ncbi:MAG TPA: DUF2807 domain-containing protein [Bacteroidia bacterium]|jgi:hypothetical protein|nr:DUF2807 domain-containing protein [Bacteroidia bacterium]
MLRYFNIVLACLIIIALSSCKKACNCVESTGEPTEQTVTVPYFEQINAYNNINVFISMGSPEQVQIQGGKNLLSNVSAEVSNGVLILKNNNICNWLRSYAKSAINVYITMPRITYITSSGVGTIQSTDTLTTDTIQVTTSNTGNINLTLNNQLIEGHLFGSSDLSLAGKSHQFLCSYVGGTGSLYCNNLTTGYTFFSDNTTGDCYIGTTNLFDIVISQIGNVYYLGNPTIHPTITGSGQLIHE